MELAVPDVRTWSCKVEARATDFDPCTSCASGSSVHSIC